MTAAEQLVRTAFERLDFLLAHWTLSKDGERIEDLMIIVGQLVTATNLLRARS